MNDRDVVIVEAVRTPIGRGHREKGDLRDLHPTDLLAHVLLAVIESAEIDPARVETVIGGCVQQFGEQGMNITRNAWLAAGLPVETSAATVDVQCGSAQQAVGMAAALIASGVHDVVIAAGVEHMGRSSFSDLAETQTRFGAAHTPRLLDRYGIIGQGLAAEAFSDKWGLSREELDAFAVRSHANAHAASAGGHFAREIAPVSTPTALVSVDQGIRPDTSAATLAQLRPAFREDGRVTAGNSSQISDGAAAVLLMSADAAASLGLPARARIVDHTSVGCDPVTMLEGPIPATAMLLRRNGMTIDDINRFEVNEAFAPVVLAWAAEHEPEMDRVNVRGGAIALGHPLGSSGARLVTTLVHILEDDDCELGLVTMCCAGGLGTGTLVQRMP
jgi:acetyl-CoA acetyltransferase family protein